MGSEAYIGGLLDPRGGNIHPLNYALGLADAALAAGAQIYGQSKVQTVTQDGDVHLLTTARGSLCARKVLVCTNGYTGDLIPGLRQTVAPIRPAPPAHGLRMPERRVHNCFHSWRM